MADHLYECSPLINPCICHQLRSCEQRVTAEWVEHCNRVEVRTRMETLDAALDAMTRHGGCSAEAVIAVRTLKDQP